MKEKVRLLPIVELDGSEYFVDVEKRQFRDIDDSDNTVEMHSEQGREMVKAMLGTEWRKHGLVKTAKT